MDPLLLTSLPTKRHFTAAPRVRAPPPDPASMDRLLDALLSLPDPALSLDLSLDRLLDSQIPDLDKERAIDSALRAGSALLEAAKRSARKRAARHNTAAWPLPPDLTIKVFSMLDTKSLCHASCTCSMFNKSAIDPLCYANIDLTAVPKVNNTIVSTMIQRAGKSLQSLKLGIRPIPASASERSIYSSIDALGLSWNERRPKEGRGASILTRSCLLALSVDGGAAGALLRRLHLYNIDKMDSTALCQVLSACQALLDLEIVGLHVELRKILESVAANCPSITRLFIESSDTGRDDSLKSQTCVDLINGCAHIISLALKGFKLGDHQVRTLIKGIHSLKFVDLSTSYSITGTFLRNLGNGSNTLALKHLILRDCMHLKEVEVAKFLSAVLAGDCKSLRYLDISNKDGLSSEEDWNVRCYNPSSIPISRVLLERPDICLIANFPSEGSYMDTEQSSDSEISNSSGVQVMPSNAFYQFYAGSSDSVYSSENTSDNDDIHDRNFASYDWDDEVEFQLR